MDLESPARHIDTVVIGNGPSALILSFILHGNIPYYNVTHPHPDPILHAKLLKSPCLLNVDVLNLTAHFGASRISYSTQALPINVLLDTLIRPLADTEPGTHLSCVEWRYEPERAVSHMMIGNTAQAGGQWADNPVAASMDIGALSYAEMLSLPKYSIEDHYRVTMIDPPEGFHRPPRKEVADYLAAYPAAVGIEKALSLSRTVGDITRFMNGFHVGSHNLHCRHLVLASGVFSRLIPARPALQSLLCLPKVPPSCEIPLLVVGSGFTAADIIITNLPRRKILHIFKWAPEERPSPLRACHPHAYPEYAGVYQRMKLSAATTLGNRDIMSPLKKHKSNPFFDPADWDNGYEGMPNTCIKCVSTCGSKGIVVLEDSRGSISEREVSSLEYVIGRRGSLNFLGRSLRLEVLGSNVGDNDTVGLISSQSLRAKVEEDIEVAPEVFAIGSLTGDSLIRYAYGGCVYAAREILQRNESKSRTTLIPHINEEKTRKLTNKQEISNADEYTRSNGHTDLNVDKKGSLLTLEKTNTKCNVLRKPRQWMDNKCTVS
ncbi:hypothetical protein MMC14_000638 [Varicellaria rhodocarpa]|nr:hypothetical protein [Varicellaria rhodocarpa]